MKVIITGGSKGIGRGIGQTLAEAGHGVGLIARSTDLLEQIKQSMDQAGHTCAIATADLRSFDATSHAIDLLIEKLGGIDALVNNAGQIVRQSVLDIDIDQWQSMIETNINGPFYTTRRVLPVMKQQGHGHIVNISSISGYMPLADGPGYAASKYALTGFSDSLFQVVRKWGVKVTTVFPGSVDSESRPTDGHSAWKVTPREVGQAVLNLLETRQQNLISKLEIRPLTSGG